MIFSWRLGIYISAELGISLTFTIKKFAWEQDSGFYLILGIGFSWPVRSVYMRFCKEDCSVKCFHQRAIPSVYPALISVCFYCLQVAWGPANGTRHCQQWRHGARLLKTNSGRVGWGWECCYSWNSWFRTEYPFQRGFLEWGIIFQTSQSSSLCKQLFEIKFSR